MTRMRRVTTWSVVLGLIAIAASWRPTAAQERSTDVLPALLTEVRGLRAAMEQMGSSSTQAQVLIGRLQLQDGRVAAMVRRLDTVRDSLTAARSEHDRLQGALRMLETATEGTSNEPHDKDKPEIILAGLKGQVAASKANVDRLTAEELQLTSDIAAEQQRWIAINQRLDELERTLAKR